MANEKNAQELGLTDILGRIENIPEIYGLTPESGMFNWLNNPMEKNKSGFTLLSDKDLKNLGIEAKDGQVPIYIHSPEYQGEGMVYFATPKPETDGYAISQANPHENALLSLMCFQAGKNLETALQNDPKIRDRIDYLEEHFNRPKKTGLQIVDNYNPKLPFICKNQKENLLQVQVITPNHENVGLGYNIFTSNPEEALDKIGKYTQHKHQQLKKLYEEAS